MTTPTLRGALTTTVASVATTTMNLLTASTVANDVLVAAFGIDTVATVSTVPAGWVLQRSQSDAAQGNDEVLKIYTRLATGTEATSYTWTITVAESFTAAMGSVRDCVATTTPNAVSSSAGTGSTAVAPTVSTDTAGTLLMAFYAVDTSPPGTVTFSSGNMSTRVANLSASSWSNLGLFTDVFAGPGATGTRSASTTGGNTGWMSVMMAFAPAGTTAANAPVEFYGMGLMGLT